ncbi:MAG TPA: uroporphyrinogen-III C-methyltransferase [Vicinamibacterales bacterium]|nr:uroporphyrinogen-III C-methyltransferase [Vicinamibacterales bacterium]
MLRRIVYLVGAGPGAPDLISARGLRCLQQADVVIYDHLVHPRLLQYAPPDAERIDVGSAAPERFDQEAICYLLAEKAREGKLVARLKWGDPFVFDQAGVEALFLHEQGIPFEVIPGVPAGIGVPAYAGIPITYPGGGDTLTFVRGYEDEGRETLKVDWTALSALDGTIVSYAGPRQLTEMIDALIAHGRPPDESAAIVIHGTQLRQQTIAGTLQELADRFRERKPSGPALLIVGNVVGLREHLQWFDTRPLFGRRVLVTRSREQSGEIVDLLEAHGAEAIEAPLINIVPPDDYAPLDQACENASSYDWIVFTSANGASAFMDRLLVGPRDVRALADAKLCAVGPGTAARLTRFGLKVDLIPDDHSADGVVAALKANGSMRGKRVLFAKADIARDTLPEELRAAGAEVNEVVAYRTVTNESDAHLGIYRQLLERQIDAVTFSSASAIRAFVSIYGADQAIDLLGHTVVATIGPVTADAAMRYGITPQITPTTSTIPALVDALVAHFKVLSAK